MTVAVSASHEWQDACAPTTDGGQATVAVDPVAAFQLALFATDERLRNAAAESLWPREHVDRCEMEVNDADFGSLPYPQRVAALIIASAICKQPGSVMRHRVLPMHRFDVARRDDGGPERIFRFGVRHGVERLVDPVGNELSWSHGAVFRLPHGLSETVRGMSRWGGIDRAFYTRQCAWEIDNRSIGLRIPSLIRSRAIRARSPAVLVDHEGTVMTGGFANAIITDDRVRIDPQQLLRLESGGLSGAFLSFFNEVPIVRGRRPSAAILSLEIGPSIDAPVIMRTLTGDPSPRYDIESVVGVGMRRIPAFEGETIGELEWIARNVGVRQGGRLRASFEYHPLHPRRFAASEEKGGA